MSKGKHHYALPVGYKLHWYEIQSVLGRGGFGITYLARDTNLNRPVAIKEYLPVDIAHRDQTDSVQPLDADDEKEYTTGLKRFLSEAQTLARFEHPNIVRVLAVFEENNTGYMVMNYESGIELQTLLKSRRTLNEGEIMGIVMPLLDGLEIVHEAGFIHRDIKPQNILIRPDGSPVLIDFGSAREALDGSKARTLTTLVTPGYAPYEQYHSRSDKQGPWTDIYALASVIYRCILGRPPINAVDRSESIIEGTGDLLVSAKEIGGKNYTAAFLKAIDHGLQFKTQDRPQSLDEWKQDFKSVKRPLKLIQKQENDISYRTDAKRRISQKPIFIVITAIIVITVISTSSFYFYREIGNVVNTSKEKADEQERKLAEEQARKKRQQEEQKKQQISSLLEQARNDFKQSRLISPVNNNAYSRYQQVLLLDPENSFARDGIQAIAQQLVQQANSAIQEGNLDKALALLNDAERIAPGMKKIASTRQILQQKMDEHRRLLTEQETEKRALLEEQRKLAQAQEREKEIADLLEKAEKDIASLRLTSPAGNNALEKYRQVLSIAPNNDPALQGIQNIVDKYIKLAKQAADSGAYDNALARLNIAEKITPDAENIGYARDQIELSKKKAEEQLLAEEEKRRKEAVEQSLAKNNAIEEETPTAAVSDNQGQSTVDAVSKSVDDASMQKIVIQYSRFDTLFRYLNQDQNDFKKQINVLMNNAGFEVATEKDILTNPNISTMNLSFGGEVAGAGDFWSWSASLTVTRGGIEIWKDGYVSSFGPNQDVNAAITKFTELINKFVSNFKG